MTPRVGLTGRLITDGPHGECAACASPATHFVCLEGPRNGLANVSVCARHESIARQGTQGLERLSSHIESKEAFIEDPDRLKEIVRKRREAERGR